MKEERESWGCRDTSSIGITCAPMPMIGKGGLVAKEGRGGVPEATFKRGLSDHTISGRFCLALRQWICQISHSVESGHQWQWSSEQQWLRVQYVALSRRCTWIGRIGCVASLSIRISIWIFGSKKHERKGQNHGLQAGCLSLVSRAVRALMHLQGPEALTLRDGRSCRAPILLVCACDSEAADTSHLFVFKDHSHS